ncbi:cold-shock protein [Paenibacillus medicaginis]|uniref:Cold-shock protein n=1 Tax=Paenibacillus medicaginis TaxID=1470560 RepID=A0ABV5C4X8_9BACL
MYNSRKKPMEETPEEITVIWSCTSDTCKGWMRDNFAFSAQPTCSLCGSVMEKSEKKLVVLNNSSSPPTKSS